MKIVGNFLKIKENNRKNLKIYENFENYTNIFKYREKLENGRNILKIKETFGKNRKQ